MLELTTKRPYTINSTLIHKEGEQPRTLRYYRFALKPEEAKEIGGITLPEVLQYFEGGSLSTDGLEGVIKVAEPDKWLCHDKTPIEPEYFWRWIPTEESMLKVAAGDRQSGLRFVLQLASAKENGISFYELAGLANSLWRFRAQNVIELSNDRGEVDLVDSSKLKEYFEAQGENRKFIKIQPRRPFEKGDD